jgi:hypothetical protein
MIALPAVALATKIKIAAICAAAVILVSACMLRDASLRKEGEARVIERSQKQGKINEAKARKAHDRAAAPGAPKRVLEQFCRDCN